MPKGTLALDPAGMSVDRSQPLVPQLHAQLKARILSGQLAAHARLPTTRALAGALGLSRNTIVRVYEQLLDEGYIQGRTGDGSYVCELHAASAHVPKPAELTRLPDGPLWQRLQAYQPARMPASGATPAAAHWAIRTRPGCLGCAARWPTISAMRAACAASPSR